METNLLVQYLLSTGANYFDEFEVSNIEVVDGDVGYIERNGDDIWIDSVPLWSVMSWMYEQGSK